MGRGTPSDGHLCHEIEQFAARYPSCRWGPANTQAYKMRLQFFALEDVRQGLAAAADEHSRWIPDLTTVADKVMECERRRKKAIAEQSQRRQQLDSVPDLSHVPSTEDRAEAYVEQAGDDKFERFARRCEVESKSLGLIPGQTTPGKIGMRRSRELRILLGDAFEDKEL